MYILTILFMTVGGFVWAIFLESLLTPKYKYLHLILFASVPVILIPFELLGIVDFYAPTQTRTLVVTCLVVLFAYFTFHNSLMEKLIALCASILLQMVPEFIITLPLTVFYPEMIGYTESGFVLGLKNLMAQIPFFFTQLILMISAAHFIQKRRGHISITNLHWLLPPLLIQCVLSVVIIISFSKEITPSAPLLSVFTAGGLFCLFSNITAYLILKRIHEKNMAEQQAAFYEKQLAVQLDYLQEFADYDETLARIRHDLRNQLAVIKQLVAAGEFTTATQLVEELCREFSYLDKIRSAIVMKKQ